MRLRFPLCLGILLAWASVNASPRGWHFGETSVGLGHYFLSALAPDQAALGRSNPSGLALSQTLYSGQGWRAGLRGDFAFESAEESCFFICMDYNMIGRSFWNTRYGWVGSRLSPNGFGLWDGFGLEVGYARFQYHWGIAHKGWDSPYPSGTFLSGTYESHQATMGLDYVYGFRKACWGFTVEAGLRQTLAAKNEFTPLLVLDDSQFQFPGRPLSGHISLSLEL